MHAEAMHSDGAGGQSNRPSHTKPVVPSVVVAVELEDAVMVAIVVASTVVVVRSAVVSPLVVVVVDVAVVPGPPELESAVLPVSPVLPVSGASVEVVTPVLGGVVVVPVVVATGVVDDVGVTPVSTKQAAARTTRVVAARRDGTIRSR